MGVIWVSAVKPVGVICQTFMHNQYTHTANVYVVEEAKTPLLGIKEIIALNILSVSTIETLSTLFKSEQLHFERKYPSLFKKLGKMSETYNITVKTEAVAHALHTARRIPLPIVDEVKKELDKMEKDGVITKV